MTRTRRRIVIVAGLGLAAASPAGAAEPFLGRWVADLKHCTQEGDTAETMPVIVRPRTLEWFVARCSYRGSTKRAGQWHIKARCSAEGETSTTPITLRLRGGRLLLSWGGPPVIERQRCP